MSFKKGQKVRLAEDNDNENYTKLKNKIFIIDRIVPYSDPAYDQGVYPQKLYDLKTMDGKNVPFSLYDWELQSA